MRCTRNEDGARLNVMLVDIYIPNSSPKFRRFFHLFSSKKTSVYFRIPLKRKSNIRFLIFVYVKSFVFLKNLRGLPISYGVGGIWGPINRTLKSFVFVSLRVFFHSNLSNSEIVRFCKSLRMFFHSNFAVKRESSSSSSAAIFKHLLIVEIV